MSILMRITVALSTLVMGAGIAFAGERGSQEEAKALLDKAIGHVNDVGTDRAYADFSRADGGFVDRDLYVFCVDMEGKMLAHGNNAALIGRNVIEMRDPDGVQMVKASIRILSSSGAGTINFKWPNPISKKIEAKSAFIARVKSDWCGVGYYKS
jgi:signal transduction histidine kinase